MHRRTSRFASIASILGILFVASSCSIGCGGSGSTDVPGEPGTDTGSGDGSDETGGGDGTVDTGGGGDTGSGDDTGSGGDSGDDTGGSTDADDGSTTDTGGGIDADDGSSTDTGPVDTGPDDTGPADTGSTTDTGTGTDSGSDPCGGGVCSVDTDSDGIPDSVEGRCAVGGPTDTDKDGTPDYLDFDSDADGIPDKVEWAGGGCDPTLALNDADGDGIPNFRDLDSDGNGMLDKDEACPPAAVLTLLGKPACTVSKAYDFDGDGLLDFLDPDNDHDSASTIVGVGLDDKFELVDSTGKYVGLVDSDGDGIPDVYDRDSDNDTIADLEDGISDLDKDGKQNFRDTDSDGDGVPDKCEARGKAAPPATDITLPVVDTDGDGKPDYLDLDSDGDLLTDGIEDKNFNCIQDTCETSRVKKDTDADGVDDFVESTLSPTGACWGSDGTMTPAKAGKFYFIEPYSSDGSAKPSPTKSPLALSTTLNEGDVAFIVDTTGSMGGTITGLKTSLSTTIIPALKAKIPSLGVGVAAHDDFPISPYGGVGDYAFWFPATPQGYITTVTADSQTAANALTTHWGNDGPESQIAAMYKALTGVALTWPGGSLAADSPPAGTFGAMRFRNTALPIVINLTDINGHNGKYALDKTGTTYSAITDPYSFATWNVDDLVTKMNSIGAKFIGGGADGGSRCMTTYCPYGFLSYIADKTTSLAPPTAFVHGSTCPVGQCCTGVSGAGVAPDGPTIGGVQQCRLVFSYTAGTGSGLSTSIVDGVSALLASIKFDVYVQAYNDVAETTDVVGNFMQKVEPNPAGGTDPVTGGICVVFPSTQLADNYTGPKALSGPADGVWDTIKAVTPGSLYCFDVTPKPNTTVVQKTTAQLFKAWLKVLAIKPTGGTFALGADREVLFIVPPIVN